MAETFTSAINGPDDDAPFRARLSFDLDVDICVVGAGLAGLTVALEAARLGASVAVLEGRHVGWNASGHQLGTVMPGYSLPIGDLIERVGLEDARELWAMSKEGADYVRAAATEEAMPGIALTEGALEVSTVDAGETLISRLQTLSEDFETEVEGWQVDRVRGELGTARYFHGIYYPRAFQIDGRKYVHGLAAQAKRAGARIFEDTPVQEIDPAGVRKRIVTEAYAGTNADPVIGGTSAENIDYFDGVTDPAPIVFAFVLGLSLVLLTVAFRSLVVAVTAIALNLLSVGAAYGLLVLVFQHGWGAGLLGFTQLDVIEAWVPLFLFSVLFGLSMDYQVFLLSRIRERYDTTRDTHDAVRWGVASTARIITGAALIIVAVFSGFARGDLVMFQQMGFGVAVALLIDATIIRSVLLPSVMTLLGDRNWYLPRWLEWIPHLEVEGHTAAESNTAAST